MLNIKVILPEKVSRLRNLSFLLGLVGMLALQVPSVQRQLTGDFAVSIGSVDLVANRVTEKGTLGTVVVDRNQSDPDELKSLAGIQFITGSPATVRSEPTAAGETVGTLTAFTPVYVDTEDEAAQGTGYVYVSGLASSYDASGQLSDTNSVRGYVLTRQVGSQRGIAAGTVVVERGSLDYSPIYHNNLLYFASFLLWPFKALSLLALIWLLFVFILLMAPIYRLVAQITTILNYIFAFITERSNPDLTRYLVRTEYYHWKILVAISGLTHLVPHLDIYATEKERLPLQFASGFQNSLSRNSLLIRLGILGGYAMLAYGMHSLALNHLDSIGSIGYGLTLFFISLPFVLLALLQLGYILLQLTAWLLAGILGRPIALIYQIMFRIQKFFSALNYLIMGLTNNPRLLLEAWSSSIATEYEDDPDDTETQYDIIEYDPTRDAGIEINLLVLYLLVVTSGSIYTFCWLARVIKLMADDAFTILLLLGLSGTIFSLYLLPEYYRRTEARRKQSGRVLIELLLMLPGVNLLIGPFVIQYLLNRYEMLRRRQG